MKSKILVVTVIGLVAVLAEPLAAQKAATPKTKLVAKADSANAPTPPNAPTAVRPAKAKPAINADLAYKANCLRCHGAPRKFSDRAMVTIMQHMRVRANLTADEAQAILAYLTE